MSNDLSRRSALKMFAATLTAPLALGLSGCGSLFYPERRYNKHSPHFDGTIVLLNGIGLLFYIIPGLIAFAVDFATGAIYLPPGQERGVLIRLDPKHLTPEEIRDAIYEETGIEIDLADPTMIVKELNSLGEMESRFAKLEDGKSVS
jgi:hypothetical protein